ncbi:hypothetical protein ACHAWF_000124 [Thalassiosira exigua]
MTPATLAQSVLVAVVLAIVLVAESSWLVLVLAAEAEGWSSLSSRRRRPRGWSLPFLPWSPQGLILVLAADDT